MPLKNTGKKNEITKLLIKKSSVSFKLNKKNMMPLYDTFTSLDLYDGKVLTPEEYKELVEKSKFDTLYFKALKTLRKDGYSTFAIRHKLWEKGATIEESRKIIYLLKKDGYLNDEKFAENYATEVGPYKGYGKNKIIYNLKKTGVSEDVISSLEFSKEEELKKAKDVVEVLNKKLSKNPTSKKKEKILMSLVSKGFDFDIAEKSLDVVTPNDKTVMRKQLKIEYDNAYRRLSNRYYGKELRLKLWKSLMNKGYELEEIVDLMKEEGTYDTN